MPRRKLSFLINLAAIIVALSYVFSFEYQFSTLEISLMIVTLVFVIPWFLFRRTFHKTISKILKYSLILILIFVVSFVSVGFYLFNTSGYPPSYVPQISYPNILNASLTQYLQSVEQSESFRFLQFEHEGSIAFVGLTISTYYSNAPGGLMWTFYARDTNVKITMGQSEGIPYYTAVFPPFSRAYFPLLSYPSAQSIKQSFNQIDALGLRWYFNQAVSAYQNKTNSKPVITELGVDVSFDNQNNYQGITITLTGFNLSNTTGFTAEFQTNGTLLSFSE